MDGSRVLTLDDVRDQYRGRAAVIVASGPSASRIDHRIYRHVVIAVNAGVLAAPEAEYFFSADSGVMEMRYWPRVMRSTQMRIAMLEAWEPGVKSRGVEARRTVGYEREAGYAMTKTAEKLIFGKSSAHCAVHFAVVLGCSPIYLIGCDCQYRGGRKYAWEEAEDIEGRHFSGALSRHIYWARDRGGVVRNNEYAPNANGKTDSNLRTDVSEWRTIRDANPRMDIRDASGGALVNVLPQVTVEEMLGA